MDKIIISQSDVKRLCDDIIPGSFRSISKIDYEKLNSRQIHLIGIYGRNSLIAKLLLDKGIIDDEMYAYLRLLTQLIKIQGYDFNLISLFLLKP